MSLKLAQLKKLSKRERKLALIAGLSLVLLGYWYIFVKPELRSVKDLAAQESNLITQIGETKANSNREALYQQAASLNAQKVELQRSISELKKTRFITEKNFINQEISRLGNIQSYELSEVERNQDAIKYNLTIEHVTEYNKFIASIRAIEEKYPQLMLTAASMDTKSYKSEWSVWIKQ